MTRVLILLFATALFVFAAEPIHFGRLDLVLGTPKNEVRTTVCAAYEVACDPLLKQWDGDMVAVYDAAQNRTVGRLEFAGNRLSVVHRSWLPVDPARFDLAKTIIGVLSMYSSKTGKTAVVRSFSKSQPESAANAIILDFGTESVTIMVLEGMIEGSRIKDVDIYESFYLAR